MRSQTRKHSSTSEAAEPITARCGSLLTSFENIPHEEVFRECTIFGIFFDS